MQKGNISIHAQNIMPVIKRWLYSDKDIFIREMVSNGCDAITKYHMVRPEDTEALSVHVTVDPQAGELRFEDNGIGMTWEEVEKYINQVAFSSAEEFLKNYSGEDKSGIIGHFGLGFYSAFMAADRVTIDTLSWQEGAKAVRWESSDGMTFEMTDGERATRGTVITLHIMEEEKEFLDEWKVREILEKYCGYMSVPVYLEKVEPPKKEEEKADADKAEKDQEAESGKEEEKKEPEAPKPINETHPLWLKNPKDCTDEEYRENYRKLFHTFDEPLFWIHLNVDYPFNLKGILYFPKIKKDFGGQEGEIKLFNRQVFVADNIKEVIPEFLMLLRGVIDCPDLPLNVSRSFLQNDGYVRKLSAHITKKVADKLNSLFKEDVKQYQTYWDDIHPFIKYGCLRDRKFFEMVSGILLYKTTDDRYLTLGEYRDRNTKAEKKVYYTTDKNRQAAAIALYTGRDIDVVVMDTLIDMNFMSFMEMEGGEDAPTFVRVDAGVDGLTDEEKKDSDLKQEDYEKLFRDALGQKELEVRLQALADQSLPALLVEDEQMRRYKEMSAVYGQSFNLPDKYSLVLNTQCDTVKKLNGMEDAEMKEMLCRQIYDLARLSSRPLESEDLKQFIERSQKLMAYLAK